MLNNVNDSSLADFEHLLLVIGKDILLNGQTVRALITNTNLEQNYDDKKISSLDPLKRGDLIEYDGNTFMIVSEEAGIRYNKWKGIMRLLPYTITFNASCVFYSVPTYIQAQSLGVQDGQVMTLAEGKLYVNIPDNEDTQNIKANDRFIKFGQAFKIVGVDRYSKPGIIILTCEKDQINPAVDDVENEIAGGLACTVEITNQDPVEVYEGETLQMTWTATNGFPVVFNSSDASIATIDNNGLITGHTLGMVNITVSHASSPAIHDTVTVNVVSVPVSFSINITSANSLPNEIKNNQSKTYNAEIYNGATLVTDGSQSVTWQILADNQTSSTTLALITSQSGSSCTVKNNGANSGYVQLRAMLNSDNSIIAWHRIQMKPLF